MSALLTLGELAACVRGDARLFTATGATRFDSVCTDSRTLARGACSSRCSGERFDAHDFVADVAHDGAAAALVERRLEADVRAIGRGR